MTWQVTILGGLAVVLMAGFAWYERSRPPARLVALVAALAALAVAGRLAFAPIPNVMATTDIALLTGYALGPAPGFAVGALAAPISNIWLGQGPWTAWEMAGWGMAGLIGAALAAVAGRGLGRLALATCCALAGLAYGALLDLSVMVTYGGEQSLERYLALSARGIPFNLAHAAGNFAIAFAIGPALVRMLARYRTRLEFAWRPAGAPPALRDRPTTSSPG
jgi:energy-coupling factor transport system substrate-specific component